jgi:outer membrane protein OmpA-like peptidoglycan-associated protein
MGSAINSEFEDYGPVLDANEDFIVFTTRRQDGNTNENVADDNKYYEDIFVSEKVNGAWKSAKNIGPPVNTGFYDSNLTLSADGKFLFIYKDDGAGDIYVSERGSDGKWGTPEPLPGVINSSYRESSVSISTDEKTLFFASDRPGGYGGSDIYVCTKDSKGEWSRVKNLGPRINTEFDEDGPFISFDSKNLYFSSEAHKGMGGFDIFRSEWIDPEKNEWGDPENIGYPINTPDDDVFYTTSKDGLRSYYSSVREGGYGYTDIYVITDLEKEKASKQPVVAKEEPKKEEPVVEEPKKEEPVKEEPKKEEPVKEEPKKEEPKKEEPKKEIPKKEVPAKKPTIPIKYMVTVVDAETNAPLDVKIRMQGVKDKIVVGMVDKGEGVTEFSITSTAAKDYLITVEKDGYIFETMKEKIAGATTEEKTTSKTIKLRKLKVNAVSILRNIYFDFNKATFKTESNSELNRLETMMKQNPNLQVEISGHTDFVGTKEFNKALSLRRANAVRSFLTSKGVDPRRIKTKGYGEERPIASNDDEQEGRELNRRVEFKVLGN